MSTLPKSRPGKRSTPSPLSLPPAQYQPPPPSADPRARLAQAKEQLQNRVYETDLFAFVWAAWHVLEPSEMRDGWHLRLLCRELEAVTAGSTKNLLLNLPPRHGKSLIASVFWPVWEWISRPQEQYLCVSYDLALTQDLARRARDLIKSDWFQSRWGSRFALSDDQDAKGHYTNDRLGARISITVRGGATGKGGSRVLIDDAHNVKSVESDAEREGVLQWWGNVIKSRRNNPDAAFVVVMQRCHEQDLTGHILETEAGEWRHVCLPARAELPSAAYDPRTIEGEALWEEMYPIRALDELQRTMDPYAVSGQYQQRPVSRKGGLFDASRIEFVDRLPAGVSSIRAWDLGATSGGGDETAGILCSETEQGALYLSSFVVGQWGPAEVEQIIVQTAAIDGPSIPICLPQDPGQAGKSQGFVYVTRTLRGYDVRLRRPTGPKTTRAAPWASLVRLGQVFVVRGPGAKEFIAQVAVFPRGKRDDMIDAVSDGFAELCERGGGGGSLLSRDDLKRAGIVSRDEEQEEQDDDEYGQKAKRLPGGYRW